MPKAKLKDQPQSPIYTEDKTYKENSENMILPVDNSLGRGVVKEVKENLE